MPGFQWRKLEEKMGEVAGARLQRSSGLHLADGVCGASLRAGPGRARPPNEFWCIFTINLSLQVTALAI